MTVIALLLVALYLAVAYGCWLRIGAVTRGKEIEDKPMAIALALAWPVLLGVIIVRGVEGGHGR
jgi:hypothetical protein